MKTIQRIGILFILPVFLFGTTGMSVLNHSCNSSNKKFITVYPEIFRNSGSSCCSDETTGYACAKHTDQTKTLIPALDEPSCCKSTIAFFKLEIISERVGQTVAFNIQLLNQVFPLPAHLELPAEQVDCNPVHFQFYSPPLIGKMLVFYLHQLKIPAHPSVV